MNTDEQERRREQMVELDIAGRGVRDVRVLAAMREVPREAFVPEALIERAWDDHPLPIGAGQTISQPYIVALMCEALRLRAGARALEVGTGSGYASAVLGRLAAQVDTVERIASLAERARQRLAELGAHNVQVHCADGTLGWPKAAPYDAILVSAAGPVAPPALRAQLAIGGCLVMPVDSGQGGQELLRITRLPGPADADASYNSEFLARVSFVRLIGEQGWPEAQ
jgi:protein-L-isoaspartate(D-aspartate) O-methyltransferase